METASSTLTGQIQAIPTLQPHYTNDLWVCGILVCLFIMSAVLSDRKHYLTHLLRGFFLPRENAIEGVRTTCIAYLRLLLFFVSLASTGLLLTVYASSSPSWDFGYAKQWFTLSIGAGLFYLLKTGIFLITNRIFFDSSTTKAWEQSYANWTILSSIPLYLVAALVVFFNLSSQSILLLFAICVGMLEMCLLYKAFCIFSPKKYGILQIFIYLCTLELMPLLVAAKALVLFV